MRYFATHEQRPNGPTKDSEIPALRRLGRLRRETGNERPALAWLALGDIEEVEDLPRRPFDETCQLETHGLWPS